MKFEMKLEVDAEQFLPEKDQIPEGVTSDGRRSPKLDPRCAWVLSSGKGMQYLNSGDYVVTYSSGERVAISADVFEANYHKVEEPKK